jgi:phytoene synthase
MRWCRVQLLSERIELPTPHTDLAYCRDTLSGGSRSFWVASHLLPANLRNDASGLYAFCREADDLIDEGSDPQQGLLQLQSRLDAIYAQQPMSFTVDRVMSRIVHRHNLPRKLLDALLEGFAWDATGKRYETLSDVLDYGARVAGVVGIMMTIIMGSREGGILARAADLGVAMQLTNIARDVGEDAKTGRLYLPQQWLREAGIDPDHFLQHPSYSPALKTVIERLLKEAAALYERAESGIPELPMGARPGIYAARLLYAEIGNALIASGGNSVDKRAIIGAAGKTRLVMQSLRWMQLSNRDLMEPPLRECAFMIHAVQAAPHERKPPSLFNDSPFHRFYRRLLWTLDLFAALDQRDAGIEQQQTQ